MVITESSLSFCYNVSYYKADFAELESESSFCTDKFSIIAAHFSITKRFLSGVGNE